MSDQSGTGTGGNEGGAAVAAGAAGGSEAGGGAPDIASLIGERFDGLGSRFDAFEQRLTALEPEEQIEEQGAAAAGAAGDEVFPEFSEEDFDERGDVTLEAQTREMNRLIQQGIETALAPIAQERQQEKWDAYTDALEERYPDLADPDKAQGYIDRAVQRASDLGHPELARNPHFLEDVYLRTRAEEQSDREIPAGSQREVTIERGSGAGPAASSDDRSEQKSIVKAVNSQQFRLGR